MCALFVLQLAKITLFLCDYLSDHMLVCFFNETFYYTIISVASLTNINLILTKMCLCLEDIYNALCTY